MSLLQTALEYHRAGLIVLPDDPKAKYPVGLSDWQKIEPTEELIKQWFERWPDRCIGVRDIEGIDIDNKGQPGAEELYREWLRNIGSAAPVLGKLLVESTPSGGYHIAWKCSEIEGNQPLARRAPTEAEKGQNPKARAITLIETRGSGGQFVVSPSPGYKLVQGDWRNLPEITPGERRVLLDAARALNQYCDRVENGSGRLNGTGARPGDDYNERGQHEALEVLLKAGWSVERDRGEAKHLCRPGKDRGTSATFGAVGPGVFYPFSTNASPFDSGRAYSPFAVYATLEHGGDYHAAAKELFKRGYGSLETSAPDNTNGTGPESVDDSDSEPGWRLFTLADAYQERPPLAYVVQGLFCLPSLNILYGPPGCLKSMLLAEATVCTAAGLPWLEPLPGQTVRPFQTISTPALWVDFDNGPRRTHERLEAFGRTRSLSTDIPLAYVSMPSPWLDASDKTMVDRLITLVRDNGFGIIALDNLGTISGGVDENSGAMIPVMGHLRRLAEETGAAVIVIHHQRKSTGTKGRAGDSLRGHSSIEAALDLALLIERKENSDRVSVKSTKTRDVDVLPFAAEWTYEHKPDSTELAAARFFGVTTEGSETTKALELTITACVQSEPGMSQNKLKEAVKVKIPDVALHTIRNQILAMADSGRLKVSAGGQGNGSRAAYYPNGDYVDF